MPALFRRSLLRQQVCDEHLGPRGGPRVGNRVPRPPHGCVRYRDLHQVPGGEQPADRVPRHQGHAQSGRRAGYDRPVGAERQSGRLHVERGQQRLARLPGTGTGLAHQPRRPLQVETARHPGRAHHDQRVAPDGADDGPQRGWRPPGDHQVGLVRGQQPPHVFPGPHLQAQFDAGMLGAERRQHRGQHVLARGCDRREPHLPVAGIGLPSRGRERLGVQAQDRVRVSRVGLPGGGQPQPAPLPFQQWRTDVPGQRRDGRRNRGLRHHQALRRGPDRPGLRHRHERPEPRLRRHRRTPRLTDCSGITKET